jgi:phage gp29-like protein
VLSLSEAYLLDRYDYRQGDFTIPANSVLPTPTQGPQDASMSFFALDKPPIVNGSTTFTPDQQVIEDLADSVLQALNSPIDPKLIASAIRAAKNPQDLEDRLASVLINTDITEFSQTLEKALFCADILGYADAR